MGKAESPSRQEAMIKHVSELCALNLAVALAKPLEFAQFHVSKLDEDTPSAQQPPIQVWKNCLVCPFEIMYQKICIPSVCSMEWWHCCIYKPGNVQNSALKRLSSEGPSKETFPSGKNWPLCRVK